MDGGGVFSTLGTACPSLATLGTNFKLSALFFNLTYYIYSNFEEPYLCHCVEHLDANVLLQNLYEIKLDSRTG